MYQLENQVDGPRVDCSISNEDSARARLFDYKASRQNFIKLSNIVLLEASFELRNIPLDQDLISSLVENDLYEDDSVSLMNMLLQHRSLYLTESLVQIVQKNWRAGRQLMRAILEAESVEISAAAVGAIMVNFDAEIVSILLRRNNIHVTEESIDSALKNPRYALAVVTLLLDCGHKVCLTRDRVQGMLTDWRQGLRTLRSLLCSKDQRLSLTRWAANVIAEQVNGEMMDIMLRSGLATFKQSSEKGEEVTNPKSIFTAVDILSMDRYESRGRWDAGTVNLIGNTLDINSQSYITTKAVLKVASQDQFIDWEQMLLHHRQSPAIIRLLKVAAYGSARPELFKYFVAHSPGLQIREKQVFVSLSHTNSDLIKFLLQYPWEKVDLEPILDSFVDEWRTGNSSKTWVFVENLEILWFWQDFSNHA
jgi:hypothetical protein